MHSTFNPITFLLVRRVLSMKLIFVHRYPSPSLTTNFRKKKYFWPLQQLAICEKLTLDRLTDKLALIVR